MNWVTVLRSTGGAACFTLALVYLYVWCCYRGHLVHLLFSLLATAVAVIAICEMQIMFSDTPAQIGQWIRWIHIPIFVAVVSTVWFVWYEFHTGRLWLALAVCAVRSVALIVNFLCWPNLNFSQIDSITKVNVLGQAVARPVGIVSQRTRVGELASLLLLAFVVDASLTLWRGGSTAQRRRAVVVGGSVVLFVVLSAGPTALIHLGIIRLPYTISLAFLIPIAAMSYQLAVDVARSQQLARDLDNSRADLHESERQMELAFDAAELGTWRWDVSQDDLWVSKKGRELLGLNGSPKVTRTEFLDAIVPEDRPAMKQALEKSLATSAGYEKECRVRLADGGIRWVVARGRVENAADGKPIVRGVCLDVTARKDAEARFRLVIEASPNAMVVTSADGRITLANAQVEALFAYAPGELIGLPIDHLLDEESRPKLERHRRECLAAAAGSALVRPELTARRKDGDDFPCEIACSAIRIAEQPFMLASIIDVTARFQAEREHAHHRNELAHLSRVAMLGELSGSLAHELNQPLTAILSNAQAAQKFLAQDDFDLEDLRGTLQDIVDEDRRAREAITRLRRLFQKGEVQYEPLDLNELVQEVLKLLNSDLINHGVRVRTSFRSELPIVRGDRVQLQQVLINLIVNATDAMSRNEMNDRIVRVSTTLEDLGKVRMSVCDTGSGIAPDQLERIFDPFHTTKSQGLGLGLTVCRTILTAHGGTLQAVNNPDRGACFYLDLPQIPVGVSYEQVGANHLPGG